MKMTILVACVLAEAAAAAPAIEAPPPRKIAPGVTLVPGAMLPERGPDGNTVIFDAPEGLVVVDTGRHDWHLDHTSGNGRIRAAFPDARIHATGAVDGALADGGFLLRNLESAKAMLDDPKLSEVEKEEVKIFIATMDEQDVLRPQVVVKDSGESRLAGRPFDFRLTNCAVTDADLWFFDRASGVAVIGDLVTLPAPFFETACPADWRRSLDEVGAQPFRIAIPGHGEPMDRQQFDA